ncbi:Putative SOS response-associated peptidase YedK [Pandoraea pneumonica]|uniref:SOS response-associated peptidase YedK n=1 Tax=Pandoraea pneumonica TaxID=2508299 RepID=A0A5E4RP64_9BURK|nr:SOS response-associated peptidase family protein [Pandoraea pneumonica]VVD64274.1 Putative SOS response-associated peptidase YedK [Pandoraea pneumonica]
MDIRIIRARGRVDYARALGEVDEVDRRFQGDTTASYNHVPGELCALAMRRPESGLSINGARWGFAPDNDIGKRYGPQPFAQVETAMDKPYFSEAWLHHRYLVCACGWTIVRNRGTEREAWHVRPRDGEPVFLLALGAPVHWSAVDGFSVLVAPAPGKLAELAPRVPVTMPGSLARFWMDPGLTPHERTTLASRTMMGNAFEWSRVTQHAMNPDMDGPALLLRAPKMGERVHGYNADEWWEKPKGKR